MTVEQFNKLSTHDKYDLTFNHGVFIEYFINGNQRFALYSVYMFYVEVAYCTTENKIKELTSFDDGGFLGKYSFFKKFYLISQPKVTIFHII